MEQSEVCVGFPEIGGYAMQAHIISDVPNSIALWFYNVSDDRSALIDIHVFLVNARMDGAHLEFGREFPPVISYEIKDQYRNGDALQSLSLHFENGYLSYTCDRIVYTKSARPIDLSNLAASTPTADGQ